MAAYDAHWQIWEMRKLFPDEMFSKHSTIEQARDRSYGLEYTGEVKDSFLRKSTRTQPLSFGDDKNDLAR